MQQCQPPQIWLHIRGYQYTLLMQDLQNHLHTVKNGDIVFPWICHIKGMNYTADISVTALEGNSVHLPVFVGF